MEKRLIVPATTFLTGLAVFVAFFVMRVRGGAAETTSAWDVGVALLVGILMFVSGMSCIRADGPAYGGRERNPHHTDHRGCLYVGQTVKA